MAGAMLSLSSTRQAIESIERAKDVSVQAYTLHGPVLRAVKEAASRGANVSVELEAHPFDDRKGSLAKENAHLVRELRAAGVRASLADWIHAKEIEVDGSVYLDEKNWHDGDIVLREDDPAEARSIPMMKDEALAQEAKLLAGARVFDNVIVESESFGAANPAYNALKALGEARAVPRLLVSQNDLRNTRNERSILRDLVAAGVRVRVCRDSAKLAACGDSAWLGSANATYAGKGFDMTDWGVRTGDAAIAKAVRDRLEAVWKSAKPFRA
jgi:hypothetical protein